MGNTNNFIKKQYEESPWLVTRRTGNLLRLWAEVFRVMASGSSTVRWQQVSEDLVPVSVTCVQDAPQLVFRVTAYNSQVDKILDVRLIQPGTRLGQASECFVYWKDPAAGVTWGLNFTSSIDARQFREVLSPTIHDSRRTGSAQCLTRPSKTGESGGRAGRGGRSSSPAAAAAKSPPSRSSRRQQPTASVTCPATCATSGADRYPCVTSPSTIGRQPRCTCLSREHLPAHHPGHGHTHRDGGPASGRSTPAIPPAPAGQFTGGAADREPAPRASDLGRTSRISTHYSTMREQCPAPRWDRLGKYPHHTAPHLSQTSPRPPSTDVSVEVAGRGLQPAAAAHLERQEAVQERDYMSSATAAACGPQQVETGMSGSQFASAGVESSMGRTHRSGSLGHGGLAVRGSALAGSRPVSQMDMIGHDYGSTLLRQRRTSQLQHPHEMLGSGAMTLPREAASPAGDSSVASSGGGSRRLRTRGAVVCGSQTLRPVRSRSAPRPSTKPQTVSTVSTGTSMESPLTSPEVGRRHGPQCTRIEGYMSEPDNRRRPSNLPLLDYGTRNLIGNACFATTPSSSNSDAELNADTEPNSPTYCRLLLEYEQHLRNALARGDDAESCSLRTFQAMINRRNQHGDASASRDTPRLSLMPTESVTATLPRGSRPPRMESRLADDQSARAPDSRDLATDQSADRMSLGHLPNATGHIYDSVAQRCGSLGRRWTGETRSCTLAEMQRLSHPSSCSVQQTSVESCDPRLCFLTSSEMSDDDRMSLTTPISDEEEGASSNPAGYGEHTADGMAASFNCTGAVRKAGYLSVKKWLLRKKHQVELARKRGWKGYWVCLKGTTLLFYPCESDEGRSIEQAPKHLIIVDGAIMQAIPEHPKRENIFCLSTAFGDAYLFQAPCESELDNWVNSIHTACAAAFARHRGKTGTLHLLQEEILRQERSIDSDSKLKYMAELQQGLTEDSVEKADVSTQIAVYDESLERLHCEQFRLKCYMASLQGGELPNPKGLLTRVSRSTKITLNRLGVFAVSSFHAYICARSPSLLNNLLAGRGATKRRAPMLGSGGSSGSNLYFNEGDDCGTGPRRSYRVQLPDQQCVSIGLRDNMTVEDFLVNACLRKDLNPPEHFLRVKKRRESETVSYFVPLRTDLVQAYLQTYEVCEICVKRLYQTELVRRDLSQMWGFSVEAELIENLDRQDELCCYVSRVEEKSLAGVNGLIRGDEIMVINGAIVADLDMMYIETLLQEEVSLCIMARTARTEPPCVEDTEPSTDELIERLVCPPPPSEAIVTEQAVGGMIAPSIRTWELDSIKPTPYAPAYSDISEQSQLSVFTDNVHQGASPCTDPCRSPMDQPRTASPTSSVTSTQSQSTQPAGGARSTELPDTRQGHTSHELDSWTDVESPPPMEHGDVQQLSLERPVELTEGAGHRLSNNESIERTNQPTEQLQESGRQPTEHLQESGRQPTEQLQESRRQPTEQLTVRWQVSEQHETGQTQSEDAETDQSVVRRKSQEPPEIRRKPPRQIEAKQQSMKQLMKNEQTVEELENKCHQPEKQQAKLQLTDADKLKMQLRELIDTERSYVQNLNSLIDNYLAPLRGEDFISDGEVDALFGNIPNIVCFQRQFLICLEQAIGHESLLLRLETPAQFKDVLFSVGNAFLQHSLSFKLYSTFCTSHSRAQKVLHPNEGNQHLQQFLQRQNPGQQHSSTLESYLIKPIQRILKYPLILQQLRGLADPQSGEYYHLEEALKAMEKIAEYINEVQRIHEEYGAIFDHLARQHEKSSSVLPLTTFVDLSPGELLHYGGVEWLNIGEFLGKIKKGLELHSMCFVFRTAVVLLCKERLRQKKRLMGTGGKGGTSEVEIVRYQVLIPVTEVQVRSNSEKDTGTRFLWDLLHLKSQIHRRNEKIYHLSNSDNEYRNSFLRTIRLSIRESVRNMSIPVSKTSGGGMRASGTLQPNRTLSGRRRAENGRPYPATLAPKVSLGALNSRIGDSGGAQKSQNKTIAKHEQ